MGSTRAASSKDRTSHGPERRLPHSGQRLIDGVVCRLADAFFESVFSGFGGGQMVNVVTGEQGERPPSGLSPLVWAPALILCVAALIAVALWVW